MILLGGPIWMQFASTWLRPGPIGLTLTRFGSNQLGPNLAPTCHQLAQSSTWPQLANGPKTPTGPNLAPTWSQHDITWPQLSPNLEPTWSQNALTQFDLEPRSPHGKNARVGRIGVGGIASASDYHGIYVKL